MIRIDPASWANSPRDMLAGTDTALARVVNIFGAVHLQIACLFASAA